MDVKKIGAVAGMGIAAVVIAWLALGMRNTGNVTSTARQQQPVEDLRVAEAAEPIPSGIKPQAKYPNVGLEFEDMVPLDEDTRIRVVTDRCRKLITYERRRVPQDTMLDMIRDQGMRFSDDDIQCLGIATRIPAVHTMANFFRDRNQDRNK